MINTTTVSPLFIETLPSVTTNSTEDFITLGDEGFSTIGNDTGAQNRNISVANAPHTTSDQGAVALEVFLYIGGSLGLVGNSLVIIVVFSSTSMYLRVTNMLIINQSVLDFFASLVSLLTAIIKFGLQWGAGDFPGLVGDIFCRVFYTESILWGFYFASTMNLMALAIERYVAIVHPIAHKVHFTTQKCLAVMGFIFVASLTYKLSITIPATRLVDGNCLLGAVWPSEETHSFVGVLTFVLLLLLPLCVMVACYGRIALVLRSRVDTIRQTNESVVIIKAKKNIFRMLLTLTACFFLCWVWNQCLFLAYNTGHVSIEVLIGPFGRFSTAMVALNACVNPIIYAAQYTEFQMGLKKLFRCGGEHMISVT